VNVRHSCIVLIINLLVISFVPGFVLILLTINVHSNEIMREREK